VIDVEKVGHIGSKPDVLRRRRKRKKGGKKRRERREKRRREKRIEKKEEEEEEDQQTEEEEKRRLISRGRLKLKLKWARRRLLLVRALVLETQRVCW